MWRTLTVALAATLTLGSLAHAELARDPVKLALARELFEVSGGEKATIAGVNANFANIDKMVSTDRAGATGVTMKLVFQDFRQEMINSVPDLIAATIPVYADVYTEQELRDYLAWLKSDSGQAILRKQPAFKQQVFDAQMPLMRSLMPRMMHKAVDHVCDQSKCTDQDRKAIDAMMDGLLSQPAA